MSSEFQHIEQQRIASIKRIDLEEDYEFSFPLSICFELEKGVFKMSSNNDGSSLDIRITSWEQIQDDDGLDFSEYFLNELKEEDLLRDLIGEKILKLEIAKYKEEITKGKDWISNNGLYAGIKIETENHLMVYYNRNGGFCSIDLIDEIPDKSRWETIKM